MITPVNAESEWRYYANFDMAIAPSRAVIHNVPMEKFTDADVQELLTLGVSQDEIDHFHRLIGATP